MAENAQIIEPSSESKHKVRLPLVWAILWDGAPERISDQFSAEEEMLYDDILKNMEVIWQRIDAPGGIGVLSLYIETDAEIGPIPRTLVPQVLKEFESHLAQVLKGPERISWQTASDIGRYDFTIAWVRTEFGEPLPEWMEAEQSTPDFMLAPGTEIGQNSCTDLEQHKKDDVTISDPLNSFLQQIADESQQDFISKAKRFVEAGHKFRQTIAKLLEEPLNNHLQTVPQETPSEKQAIAVWLNGQLRDLGLAIRCPKTGRPSIMISDLKEGGSDIGRFRLENRDENGVKVRSLTSTSMPKLELMEDRPRNEPLLQWSQRAGRKESARRG